MAAMSDPGGERCLAGDGDDAVVVKGRIVGQRPQPPDRDLPRSLPGAARGEVGPPAVLRMKPFQVGLLGAGVVGGGTFAVLQRNQEEIRRRAGREIRIGHVVDVDLDARAPRRRRRRRGRQRRARA